MKKELHQKGLSCKPLLEFAVGIAQSSTSESQKSTFSRMNPDRTGRKVMCGGVTPENTTLCITEAGLHWNRFNFMSVTPRLFFPSPTILHSEMVVQPFMAAFRDSPPMQRKCKKYMPCVRGSKPQH